MKQTRRKAYQFHYEAAMSKVLHEEARKKEEAREAKKNKKRKLLPVVEDPVVKVDRRKSKSKKRHITSATAEEDGHTGFVIKLKGVKHEDVMDIDVDDDDDELESPRRHSFLAGRPTPRYLPNIPQAPPGEQLTASEMRAYDRMAKSAEKRFDAFISSVWKDIAKKDVPKAHRQMDMSLKVKQSNAKKTVQLASKEARRWQARSTKASKEMQIKAKKAMREVVPNMSFVNVRCLSFGGRTRRKNVIFERKLKKKLSTELNEKKNFARHDDKLENSTFSSPKPNSIPTLSVKKSTLEMNLQTAKPIIPHLFPPAMDNSHLNLKSLISMPMMMKRFVLPLPEALKMPFNLHKIKLKISIWRRGRRIQKPSNRESSI